MKWMWKDSQVKGNVYIWFLITDLHLSLLCAGPDLFVRNLPETPAEWNLPHTGWGGWCVCVCVCVCVKHGKHGKHERCCVQRRSWEVLKLCRTSDSLSVYYPEVTSMNSARLYLPHYHCEWLEDKLAFPYSDLLASRGDTLIKASLRVNPPFKHSPRINSHHRIAVRWFQSTFFIKEVCVFFSFFFFPRFKASINMLTCVAVMTNGRGCGMLMTLALPFSSPVCSTVPGVTSNTGCPSQDTLVDRPLSTRAN